MKGLSLAAAVLALACLPLGAHAAPDAEAQYEALLAAAKSGTAPVDWMALRYADADRPSFTPDVANPDRKAMFQAANAQDWQGALDLANRVIDKDYTDALAHLLASSADRQLGHADDAAHEAATGNGLLASIRTGDGQSFDTAFTVIAVREEYDLLLTMHLKLTRQGLNLHDGHHYDVMETMNAAGTAVTYYFQIDREWAAENRALMPH